MNLMKSCAVLGATILLTTAAGAAKATDLAMTETANLCMSYAGAAPGSQHAIRDELGKRGVIAEADWALVDQHMVKPGMTVCGLFAAWGQPDGMTPDAKGATQYAYHTAPWPGVAANRTASVADGRVASTKP